jgi:hypothetical protein
MYSIILIVFGLAENNYRENSVATEMVGKYDSVVICEAVAKGLRGNFKYDNITFVKTAQCVQVKDKP